MTKIFISYRRDDSRHVAGRLADRLDEHFQVFMDVDTIEPGTAFDEVVRRAVAECDIVLAIIGNQWVTLKDETGRRRLDDPQDWVAEELRTALQRGIPVIPILVDGARPPTASVLPPSLAGLATRQAIPIRHESFASDAAHLIAAIEKRGPSSGVPGPGGSGGSGGPASDRPASGSPASGSPAQSGPGPGRAGARPPTTAPGSPVVEDAVLYADPDYVAAVAAMFGERWAEAMASLVRVEARFPGHPLLTERLAQSRRHQELTELDGRAALAAAQGRWAEAVTALQGILTLEPAYPGGRERLQTAEQRRRATQLHLDLRGLAAARQWDGVIAAANELRQLEPDFADPDGLVRQAQEELAETRMSRRYAAGVAQLDQQNWASAYQVFSALVSERPDYRDAGALLERARQQLPWAAYDESPPAPAVPVDEPVLGDRPEPGAKRASRSRRGLVAVLSATAVVLLVVASVLVVAAIGKYRTGAGPGPTAPASAGPGSGSAGPVSAGSSGSASGGPGPTEPRQLLLGHVPLDLRPGCKTGGAPDAASGLLVALNCAPGGEPEHVSYQLFETAGQARKALQAKAGEYRLVDGECTARFQTGSYTNPGTGHPGLRACYQTGNGYDVFRWTDDTLAILVVVDDPTMGFAALKDWAESHSPV